ncbi:MAG TPA: DMT family transporter [Bacillaceae bacterium]
MNQMKYSLFVLIGASSYGISSSFIKMTIGAGYTAQEAMGGQYLFGVLMLSIALLFTKKERMTARQTFELLFVGLFVSLTSILYANSLALVPAAIAVVMLFQFTWIGILIEAVHTRKFPSSAKLVSVLLLWMGTLLAAGIGSAGFDWRENMAGVVYGLLSAVSFALFIFFSGKAGRGVPVIQRSTVISAGGLAFLLLMISPSYIIDGTVTGGLWKFGLILGLTGIILPVVLFAVGTPKIDSGTATIAGAAELPAAILAAMLILGEAITVQQTMGIALILAGMAIPQMKFPSGKRRRRLQRS